MKATNAIDQYFQLMEIFPEQFSPSNIYPIITDREILEKYAGSTGQPVGVVYQSNYHLLVVDLIADNKGGYFSYERVLSDKTGRGVVCIPKYNEKFVMLRQYRHPIRDTQLCFPRGFGENDLDLVQNAAKELSEEIGATVSSVEKLGEITIDSGFVGGYVDIALCKVEGYNQKLRTEGVLEILLLSYEEIKEMIANGNITDSFTICAFSKLQ